MLTYYQLSHLVVPIQWVGRLNREDLMDRPEKVDDQTIAQRVKGNEIVVVNGLPGVIGVTALARALKVMGSIPQLIDDPRAYPPHSQFPEDGQVLTVLFCDLGANGDTQKQFRTVVLKDHNIPTLIVTAHFPRTEGLVSVARNKSVREIVSADCETEELLQIIYRILVAESNSRVYL